MRANRFSRPSYIETDLTSIAKNTRNIKAKLPRGVALQAVVKSNGYGHGAIEVAKTVLESGADLLGVALAEEGIQLREAGIKHPIVVLYPEPPERAYLFIEYNLIPTISDIGFARSLNELVNDNEKFDVYLKVDTGMSRYGPSPEFITDFAEGINRLGKLRLAGISSNFSTSDNGDKTFCLEQLDRFRGTVDSLNGTSSSDIMISIANSGALLDLPESYHNMVRVGLLLYGYYPSKENKPSVKVTPALRLVSRVLYTRSLKAGQPIGYGMSYITPENMKIATIPIGYGDGYPRALSNKGEVLINGRRAPIVGRVCMDALMADVSEFEEVKIGDEVVLIGSQGNEFIGADEIAEKCGTITWEITCGLTSRLPIVCRHKDIAKQTVKIG